MPEERSQELASARSPSGSVAMPPSLGQGMFVRAVRDDRLHGCASWGSGNCPSDFRHGYSAPIFWPIARSPCFVALAPPGQLGPDGRLVARHPNLAGLGRRGRCFLPLGEWPAQAIHGLAESIDAEDKAMAGPRLERPGSGGRLAGSLGMGLRPSWPDCPYAFAHAAGALALGRSVQSSAPAGSPVGSTGVAASCDGPRINQAPLTDPLNGLDEILSTFEAPCADCSDACGPCAAAAGAAPCRTGACKRWPMTHGPNKPLSGQGLRKPLDQELERRPGPAFAQTGASRAEDDSRPLARQPQERPSAPALIRIRQAAAFRRETAQGPAPMPNSLSFQGSGAMGIFTPSCEIELRQDRCLINSGLEANLIRGLL